MLLGRERERAALIRLITASRAGESGAIVLRGEAGIGKTALLDDLATSARGCAVLRLTGAQDEADLPFAAIHQISARMQRAFGGLPEPQRHALELAFGQRSGAAPDVLLVGLAVLGLMSEMAQERPLVCLVDDAQWLDAVSAQVLGVVARRLDAEAVVIAFAVRTPSDVPALKGLPELAIDGLDPVHARALLTAAVTGPLDAEVRERIVAETRGNPLALLELPAGLPLEELTGGFGVPTASALPGRIEESSRRRFATLADETRRLLVVAAAEPLGDASLLWRAAEQLGIEVSGGALEAATDLVRIGTRVRFRHPLVRSAIYWSVPLTERQSAHVALASAIDGRTDPDRRAWHLAQSTLVPDEAIARALEESATRAQARGGLAAAAAFLERATHGTSSTTRWTLSAGGGGRHPAR